VFQVTNMSEVNDVFSQIADLLGETKYVQKFILEIAGLSHGAICRFTFDNDITSATLSEMYIQGTFNRVNKTLENITYVGLTSTSGNVIAGLKNVDGFYEFVFEGIQSLDGELIPVDNVQHWYKEDSIWEKDSEFEFDPGDVGIEKIKRSAAIILNLDCSSSLGDDFITLQESAKSFINKLVENAVDPNEVQSISLDKHSVSLVPESKVTLQATILPSTALDQRVEWASTNTAVAKVDDNGEVTAVGYGNASIIVKTIDGGLTDICQVVVVKSVEEIILDETELDLYVGENVTIVANVLPEDAYNKELIWSSSNNNVATIDNNGVLTAKKVGYAIITVTANDGSGTMASCSINVQNIPLSQELSHLSLSVKKDDIRYFIPQSLYQYVDLTGYSVEGLAILSESESFVLDLNDAKNEAVNFFKANDLGTMPNTAQANVIVSNWDSIDAALIFFGGVSLGNKSYWTQTQVSANNQPAIKYPQGGTPINGSLYYYYNFSNVVGSTSSTDNYYARKIILTL
ncbi:MAG: Ig domain-containing protein, partial [Bacteroidales bacterium]|nr:Ig domain-containing protein [Bacteroidales bacterium]